MNLHHKNLSLYPIKERRIVSTAQDIDREISKQIMELRSKRLGLLLSGGMDSAILAAHMSGCDAYTFRYMDGRFAAEELHRAELYAGRYNLRLHYVDINWQVVDRFLDELMEMKAAPVHSIEPQICSGAWQAKKDGVEIMVIGNGSDYVFGGMDQLLSRDWLPEEFEDRYCFIKPEKVLNESACMHDVFEHYRLEENKIDFLSFMDEIATEESYNSYYNAFKTAQLPYVDPYANLKLYGMLDLERIRNGESKYLIRELFSMKYPELPVPEKNPMPRPVDLYFSNWKGPERPEFKKDLDMSCFTGNQKWQLYCLERFLNLYDPRSESNDKERT